MRPDGSQLLANFRSSGSIVTYQIDELVKASDLGVEGSVVGENRIKPVDLEHSLYSAYGKLFGKTAEAKAAAEELDAKLAAAKAAVAGKGKALIVMANGPKVSTYGPGSRFGWVHASLNLPAAVGEIETATHGEAVSFEFIRQANPDWLLVLDRAAAVGSNEQAAKVTLDNELVAETTAWKKGQVIYLPAPDFYIAAGGVQSLERVLTTITEGFAAAK